MNNKEAISLFMSDFSFESPTIQDTRYKNRLVPFDYDNLFPNRLLEAVSESPMQTAILENRINFLWGAGFAETKECIYQPNMQDTWAELFQKCARDFVYFGAFAIQVILNQSGNRFSFYHTPVEQVRLAAYDENNRIPKAFLCTDWRKTNRDRVVEIPMWGSETPRQGQQYLMYIKPWRSGEYYYAVPYWFSCINYILADGSLSKYFCNFIKNNFSSSLSITFPTEPDEEKKREIYDNLRANFTGEKAAGNIMVLFGENGIQPTIGSIDASTKTAELYNSIVDTIKLALVSANRLTSPILAGITTSSGFSDKAAEIVASETFYRLTVINQERQFLLDKFNSFLQMNGLPRVLTIQDYNITKELEGTGTEDNTDKINEGVGADDTEEQVAEDANAENNVDKNKEGV